MILLLTGQPGHGKTAYGLVRARAFKDEGREVYIHGVKDLDYEALGFKHLDEPTKWQDLPDRAVIVIDECYTTFPNRNPGAKVPDHVEAMARHRHRGFDFILIAQQGLQLDPFLRGLYDEHYHVRQTSLLKKKTKIKKWTHYQANVLGHSADIEDWLRPNDIFRFYTSTTFVTTKRRMPQWMKWLIIGVCALGLILGYIKWSYDRKIEELSADTPTEAARASLVTGGGTTTGAGNARVSYASADDYNTAHAPRIGTLPWSAPIFDGRGAVSQPEIMCMAAGAGVDVDGNHVGESCHCLTEQGTPYKVTDNECKMIARQGGAYNPYKARQAAPEDRGAGETPAAMGAPSAPAPSPTVAALSGSQVSGYGDLGVTLNPGPPTANPR